MKITNLIGTTALLALTSLPALAETTPPPIGMPMQQGQMKCGVMQGGQMPMQQGQIKCGMMQVGGMGMMNPEIMKRKQAMMKKHMAAMEQHMANIESMLKELVELQKQK